jgi:ABC-type transporter Mla subunit MlaD
MTNTDLLFNRLEQLEAAKVATLVELSELKAQRDAIDDVIAATSEHIATLRQEIYEVNESLRLLAAE